jgi:hypothetical protein
VNELQDLLERAADEGPLADAHTLYEGALARSRKIRARRRVTAAVSSACAIALIVGAIALVAHDGTNKRHVDVAHPKPAAVQHYEATAMVLQNATHGPQLCLGASTMSIPPQCGGVPIPNWDWSKAPGVSEVNGTKYGLFHVIGTYDGTSFTLTQPPQAGPTQVPTQPPAGDFSTPCPTPAGGWNVVDPSKVGLHNYTQLTPAAESQPDYGGAWMDQSTAPSGSVNDLEHSVMNFTFTGDLDRHRAELAQIWGGPICVSQTNISHSDRQRIQTALTNDPTLHATEASSDERTGVVTAKVIVATPELQQKVDAQYGAGRVKLVSDLTPVG